MVTTNWVRAVATKAVGTAVVTFLAGFTSEAAFGDLANVWAQGGKTAVFGALLGVVIPALNKVASKAAATDIPKI